MIDRSALLDQYDREMRRDPPGGRIERDGSLVLERHQGDTVLYAVLTASTALHEVEAQARRARAEGRELEWKVYGHDLPAELPSILRRAGYVADEPETLVVRDLVESPPVSPPPGDLAVREVRDLAAFEDALRVSEAAFGPQGPETLEQFRNRLDDPTARLFVAYARERPISAGRLELPRGRSFAGLWGGGTIPEARHRGAYRALVEGRAAHAYRAGFRYLTVDARETSRPILERIGFVPLTSVQGWILPAEGPPK